MRDYPGSKPEDKEEEKRLQMPKIIDTGPPPDDAKRKLIFDSLQKIIGKGFARGGRGGRDTRGTYVYTWGAGYHGQLGSKFQKGKKKYATIPKRVEMSVAVRQVACGGLHTAAVTDTGQVYTWGDARGSQLGFQPHGFTNQQTPCEVEALSTYFIVKVACGQIHTVALTAKGDLISWGVSKFGQCGHSDRQKVRMPKKIHSAVIYGVKFQDISCGDRHTAALATNGQVYTFGCGEHGQLGHGEHTSMSSPTLIESLVGLKVVSVVCGSIHTCFITDTGDLYVCGFGEYFYPNEDQNFFYVPVKIPIKEKVIQVACGQSHIIALSDKGDVYCWGSGSYGQLGHGVKGNVSTPRLVLTGKNCAQVAAGRYHSMALTDSGILYSWGCGENGQLGHHDDNNLLFPRVIEPNIGTVVGQIACGEHHTAVLTSTPWSKVDPEINEWITLEQEEYERKSHYLKKTQYGLFRRDLMKLTEEMDALKANRKADKESFRIRELKEQREDIASVLTREQIEKDILAELDYREGDEVAELPSAETRDDFKRTGPRKKMSQSSRFSSTTSSMASPSKATDRKKQLNLSSMFETDESEATKTIAGPNGAMTARGGFAQRAVFLKESAQMVQRMKTIIAETSDNSDEAQLKKMLALTYEFRKEFDALRAVTNRKSQELIESKQSVKALKKNNDAIRDRKKVFDSRVKALEMKLNTVTIKITETEENRKNYALNIAHLKEEELERFHQLEGLRKHCGEYDAFCKKLNEMKLQSMEEKDRAENELSSFQIEIKQFQNFIRDQIDKFESISTTSKQRSEKREHQKELRNQKIQEKIAGRILKLNSLMDEKNKVALSMAQQLESVNERLRYFEKRFQQIASATGLTNPDAIINKYALKEEIKTELNSEIAAKKDRIDELKKNLAKLRSDEAQASAAFVDSSWKDVHELQNDLTKSDNISQKSKRDADRLEQSLVYFQECLYNMSKDIPNEFKENVHPKVNFEALDSGSFNQEETIKCLGQLENILVNVQHAVKDIEGLRANKIAELDKANKAEELLRNLPGFS